MKKSKSIILQLFIFLFSLISVCAQSDDLNMESQVREFIISFDYEHRTKSQTPSWATVFCTKDSIDLVQTFGVESLNSQKPIDGNTVFRIASVSKIFTALAVAIEVERGNLDLNVNIQEYINFDLGLKYPVTLKQLLTHTAGFEMKFYNDSSPEEERLQDLGDHLSNYLPRQIYKPGEVIAYSNYGNALAGFVVESVSNTSFHEYVMQNILIPTGMNSSGYMLTESLESKLADGYDINNGSPTLRPYTWVHRYPASSMLTTAFDMQKFIKMLLNGGKGMSGHVLSAEGIDNMFSVHYTKDKDLPGMGLGWMQMTASNTDGFWHDGSITGYTAQLVILPKQESGFFIVANNKDSYIPSRMRNEFIKEFLSKEIQTPTVTISKPALSLNDYAGDYINARRNLESFESVASLFESNLEVGADSDGLLIFGVKYRPYEDHKFISEDGDRLVFEVDGGEVKNLSLNWGDSPRSYIRLNKFQEGSSQLIVLSLLLILSIAFIAIHSYRILKRSINGDKWLLFSHLSMLVFFASFLIIFMQLDSLDLRFGEIQTFRYALAIPFLSILLLIIGVVKSYKNGRLFYFSAANIILLLLWMNYWNLLGWQIY